MNSAEYQDPFTKPDNECPECQEILSNIPVGGLRDCASHLSHEELQEAYRLSRETSKRLQEKYLEAVKGTLAETLIKELSEVNKKRCELGAKRYLLMTEVEELKTRNQKAQTEIQRLQNLIRQYADMLDTKIEEYRSL